MPCYKIAVICRPKVILKVRNCCRSVHTCISQHLHCQIVSLWVPHVCGTGLKRHYILTSVLCQCIKKLISSRRMYQVQITITHQPETGNQSWHINKVSRENKDYILVDREVTIMDWVFLFHLPTRTILRVSYRKTILKFIISSHSCLLCDVSKETSQPGPYNVPEWNTFSHCMQFQQLLFLYLLRAKNNRKFCFHSIWLCGKKKKTRSFPLFLYFFFCSLFIIYLKPLCLFH